MELGLLPALGSGMAELQQSGQLSRFLDGYLPAYARAFDRVWYFSYLPEALPAGTEAPARQSVSVLAPRRARPRLLRAVAMPLAHRGEFARCAVLRVFQVTGVIPAILARARWGTPFVTTYGFWYARLSQAGPSRLAKRVLERVGLRLADAVIVPTRELGDHAATMAGRDRVHLIPNGVDLQRFAPRAEPTHDGGRILYVGRLSEEKNLGTLLQAVASIQARRPTELVLIGDGPLRARLETEAHALGVKAEFLGVLDHREVPERLRQGDLFVLPSFTEGHPKVLIEAMACGLPCVASDCAGNRALVSDGDTGLLFDPTSVPALGAALDRVLSDRELARALGRRARERVAPEYDLRLVVAEEIELLKRVARPPRR